MDDHDKEKRTEQNLFMRNGRPKSEADVTSNKILRSTIVLLKLTETKHRAASLR